MGLGRATTLIEPKLLYGSGASPPAQDAPAADAKDGRMFHFAVQQNLAASCLSRRSAHPYVRLEKRRTLSIVRCFSSSGSFQGNTAMSAFQASEATSTEVCSRYIGTSMRGGVPCTAS